MILRNIVEQTFLFVIESRRFHQLLFIYCYYLRWLGCWLVWLEFILSPAFLWPLHAGSRPSYICLACNTALPNYSSTWAYLDDSFSPNADFLFSKHVMCRERAFLYWPWLQLRFAKLFIDESVSRWCSPNVDFLLSKHFVYRGCAWSYWPCWW